MSNLVSIPNKFCRKRLQYFNSFLWNIQVSFFNYLNIEKDCWIPSTLQISHKTNFLWLLHWHWILVICLDLLKWAYSFIWSMNNPVSSYSCSHLLDLRQFYECFHMSLCDFLLAVQKSLDHQSQSCSLLFLQLEESLSITCSDRNT